MCFPWGTKIIHLILNKRQDVGNAETYDNYINISLQQNSSSYVQITEIVIPKNSSSYVQITEIVMPIYKNELS
jgi:hypothetical protein